MEKAIHIQNISQLQPLVQEKGPSPYQFQRIYLGNETCERLIPTPDELKQAKSFCAKNRLSFSLVTPFCTDAGIASLKPLLPLLSGEDELIANDFGVLKFASSSKASLVAGRLLNKQFRDPRSLFRSRAKALGKTVAIDDASNPQPKELLSHLSLSQASSPQFRKILSSMDVKRIELDNLVQGIGTNLTNTGFSASLYFPIVFVSATRFCLLANAGKISASNKVGILPCAKECSQFRFKLTSPCFPRQLLLIGNAVFFENPSLPEEKRLSSLGIDRIVTNSALAES